MHIFSGHWAQRSERLGRFLDFCGEDAVLVSDAVSQQDPDQFGARPDPQLSVDPREMRLDCLAGYKQGCCYLVIVLASCGNPGNLEFLRAQLVEPIWSDGSHHDASILHSGGCRFGSCPSRPWSRPETVE